MLCLLKQPSQIRGRLIILELLEHPSLHHRRRHLLGCHVRQKMHLPFPTSRGWASPFMKGYSMKVKLMWRTFFVDDSFDTVLPSC